MVSMEILNDAELLVNLSARYMQNIIFTYVGPTLLVINPFQAIPQYFEPEVKFKYIGDIIFKKRNQYIKLCRWPL